MGPAKQVLADESLRAPVVVTGEKGVMRDDPRWAIVRQEVNLWARVATSGDQPVARVALDKNHVTILRPGEPGESAWVALDRFNLRPGASPARWMQFSEALRARVLLIQGDVEAREDDARDKDARSTKPAPFKGGSVARPNKSAASQPAAGTGEDTAEDTDDAGTGSGDDLRPPPTSPSVFELAPAVRGPEKRVARATGSGASLRIPDLFDEPNESQRLSTRRLVGRQPSTPSAPPLLSTTPSAGPLDPALDSTDRIQPDVGPVAVVSDESDARGTETADAPALVSASRDGWAWGFELFSRGDFSTPAPLQGAGVFVRRSVLTSILSGLNATGGAEVTLRHAGIHTGDATSSLRRDGVFAGLLWRQVSGRGRGPKDAPVPSRRLYWGAGAVVRGNLVSGRGQADGGPFQGSLQGRRFRAWQSQFETQGVLGWRWGNRWAGELYVGVAIPVLAAQVDLGTDTAWDTPFPELSVGLRLVRWP